MAEDEEASLESQSRPRENWRAISEHRKLYAPPLPPSLRSGVCGVYGEIRFVWNFKNTRPRS